MEIDYLFMFSLQQMAKVLVALLRFSPKQQKELLRKVDEQVNQVSSYLECTYRPACGLFFTVKPCFTEHPFNLEALLQKTRQTVHLVVGFY